MSSIYQDHEGVRGMPERRIGPHDDAETGWERHAFCCGCGRGCVDWRDHFARVAAQQEDHDTLMGIPMSDDREEFAESYAAEVRAERDT